MNFKRQFKEGLLTKNPVTVQLLGMCSTLAITTSLFNGLGMGAAVTIITICSNILISALRKVIPSQIRIAAYIVIIASFVTIVDLLLQAFLPDLSESLGVFIPLIVVNCIVLGRAEAFASKNGVLASAVDGLCQGIGSFKFSELFDKENIRGDTNEKGFNKSYSYSNDSCYPNYSYTTLRKRYFRQQITDFLVPNKRHGTQLRSSLRYYGKHRKGVQLQTHNNHPRQ